MMETQAPPNRWLETGRLEVEMCLAMCIGGIPLNVLFFVGAAQLGYPDLIDRFPEFSILVVGILLGLPMAAWMRGLACPVMLVRLDLHAGHYAVHSRRPVPKAI